MENLKHRLSTRLVGIFIVVVSLVKILIFLIVSIAASGKVPTQGLAQILNIAKFLIFPPKRWRESMEEFLLIYCPIKAALSMIDLYVGVVFVRSTIKTSQNLERKIKVTSAWRMVYSFGTALYIVDAAIVGYIGYIVVMLMFLRVNFIYLVSKYLEDLANLLEAEKRPVICRVRYL